MNFDFRLPEIDAVSCAVRELAPMRLLDLGAGEGAMTRELQTPGALIAAECDRQKIASARRDCSAEFVQAHPAALPFSPSVFDAVVCTQVLDHLESVGDRRLLLQEARRVLRPDGRFLVTVRHQNFRFDNFGIPKQGYENGIFYHRYYLEEFKELLAPGWTIQTLQGVWNYLPRTYPIYTHLGSWVIYWERALRGRRLSLRYGKLLFAICTPDGSHQC